jgi:hypothetical protein
MDGQPGPFVVLVPRSRSGSCRGTALSVGAAVVAWAYKPTRRRAGAVHKSLIFAFVSVLSAALIAGCNSSTSTSTSTSAAATGTASSAAGSAAPSGGGSTVDAKALKQQIPAAMKAASAFHVIGKVTDDSGKPIAFDVHLGTHKAAGAQ